MPNGPIQEIKRLAGSAWDATRAVVDVRAKPESERSSGELATTETALDIALIALGETLYELEPNNEKLDRITGETLDSDMGSMYLAAMGATFILRIKNKQRLMPGFTHTHGDVLKQRRYEFNGALLENKRYPEGVDHFLKPLPPTLGI